MISQILQLMACEASRSLLRLELNIEMASGFAEFIAIEFHKVATFGCEVVPHIVKSKAIFYCQKNYLQIRIKNIEFVLTHRPIIDCKL